jgi:hypothetical protein
LYFGARFSYRAHFALFAITNSGKIWHPARLTFEAVPAGEQRAHPAHRFRAIAEDVIITSIVIRDRAMKSNSQRRLAASVVRPAYRTLEGWALGVLMEQQAVTECDHHGHRRDRSDRRSLLARLKAPHRITQGRQREHLAPSTAPNVGSKWD